MHEKRADRKCIKICGLTRPCEIAFVNAAKPDYIGFVLAKSRRQVTPERAGGLKELLDPSILAVGVFVNEKPETAARLAEEGVIDLIQLHGQEDEAYLRQLRGLTKCPVIKAFCVRSAEDVRRACESSADYILLDSGVGGTGQRFDWKMTGQIKRPWFLAGGLSPDNMKEAVQTDAFCLDISSGVETDGQKDREKIEACVRSLRAYEKEKNDVGRKIWDTWRAVYSGNADE